jgi:hypothetical protein
MCGHQAQGRFHSCIPDSKRLFAALRYVENNRVWAGLVIRKTIHNRAQKVISTKAFYAVDPTCMRI